MHTHAGSPQHTWVMAELAAVDRMVTPWLMVQMHAPVYHSYVNHYKVGNGGAFPAD